MNELHTMLLQASHDAQTVLGGPFTFQNRAYTATAIAQADEKLLMELAGFLEEADLIIVAAVDQFKGPLPETNDQITVGFDTFAIRGLKTDPSAIVLVLKKISR